MVNWIQDAGHGGKDPGAVSHGNIEKNYTLEAALYVNKRLAEHGIDSVCTRTSDVTLDQTPRTSKVRKYKRCISHHFNAGGGDGVEIIHSIYGNGQFEHIIIDEFKRAGYPVRPRPVFFKKNSRGGDYYYMHWDTGNCQTSIIEYDFVDGPQSEKIKDKAYREGMYECVVRAICREEGIRYIPLNQNQKEQPKPERKVSGMKPNWADWQWEEATVIYKNAREKGIITSDQWEKKAAAKDLTFDEIEYLNLVLNGRVL